MTGGSELMKTDGKTRGRSRGQDVRQPFAGLNAWIEAWSSGFLAGIGMLGQSILRIREIFISVIFTGYEEAKRFEFITIFDDFVQRVGRKFG